MVPVPRRSPRRLMTSHVRVFEATGASLRFDKYTASRVRPDSVCVASAAVPHRHGVLRRSPASELGATALGLFNRASVGLRVVHACAPRRTKGSLLALSPYPALLSQSGTSTSARRRRRRSPKLTMRAPREGRARLRPLATATVRAAPARAPFRASAFRPAPGQASAHARRSPPKEMRQRPDVPQSPNLPCTSSPPPHAIRRHGRAEAQEEEEEEDPRTWGVRPFPAIHPNP